jgi:RNA polymerase sigma-70 factor (ECF subfamily)
LRADANSFEEIALVHLDAVYRTAMALCGQEHQAEDLAQTTFLKAFERFAQFAPGTNCKAWLLQILRNTWIDQLRHKKVTGTAQPLVEEQVGEAPVQEEIIWTNARDLLENFSDEQVIKALSQLPEEQRLTLFLIDVERFSQEKVAEITGVAVGTVKSRTSRARASLKKKLTSYAQERGLSKGEK